MNFKDYWNSQDLDKYRSTEDYCRATWQACKGEVLELIESQIAGGSDIDVEDLKKDLENL